MTDAIKTLSENVASGMRISGAKYMSKRYADIIYETQKEEVTAEDVIDRIKRKLGEFK